jgi:hypothetical protein
VQHRHKRSPHLTRQVNASLCLSAGLPLCSQCLRGSFEFFEVKQSASSVLAPRHRGSAREMNWATSEFDRVPFQAFPIFLFKPWLPRCRGAAEIPGVGRSGRRRISPNRWAEKWGQKYAAGVNLRHISAPNLSANWFEETEATRPRQRAAKRHRRRKRPSPAVGSSALACSTP